MNGRVEQRIAISRLDDGVLRYRDRDVAELISHEPFESVWGLLVDDALRPALPADEPFPFQFHTGDVRVDLQSAIAQIAPVWGYRSVVDTTCERLREDLARATALALSFVAREARGEDVPAVHQQEIDAAHSVAERFLVRWRGETDPQHVLAIDAYLSAMAEHGLTPSTRTARLGAAKGADAAACLSAAIAVSSGPFGGGAGARSLALIEAAEKAGDAARAVRDSFSCGPWLWGFGSADGPHLDPRAGILHALCARLEVPRLDVAEAVERAAVATLRELVTGDETSAPAGANAMYWGAVLLDFAGVPARMLPAMFACGRAAGWSAHIIDQCSGPNPFSVS